MIPFAFRSLVASLVAASFAGVAVADPVPNAGEYRSFWGLTTSPGGFVSGQALIASDAFNGRLVPSSTAGFGFEVSPVGTRIEVFAATGDDLANQRTFVVDGDLESASSTTGGRFATDGQLWAEMRSGNTVTFDFSSNPLTALGFYLTDIGDFESNVSITLFASNGGKNQVFNVSDAIGGNGSQGNLAFWGFVDDSGATYDKLTISAQLGATSADFFGIDSLRTGLVRPAQNQIPVPGTLALAAAALALMTLRRRA